MRATSIPLLFVVGLAGAFVGDVLARLDPSAHHVGAAHVVHTMLVAVPLALLAALLLREDGIPFAASIGLLGWLAGVGVLAAGT